MTADDDWVSIEGSHEATDATGEAPPDVEQALYAMQDAILRYPMVVQSVFSALVAEGRRFALTPEGEELRGRLLRSRSTASARLIWELLTSNAFVERPTTVLPSAFIERFVRALTVRGIEPLIARLFERTVS